MSKRKAIQVSSGGLCWIWRSQQQAQWARLGHRGLSRKGLARKHFMVEPIPLKSTPRLPLLGTVFSVYSTRGDSLGPLRGGVYLREVHAQGRLTAGVGLLQHPVGGVVPATGGRAIQGYIEPVETSGAGMGIFGMGATCGNPAFVPRHPCHANFCLASPPTPPLHSISHLGLMDSTPGMLLK